MKVSMACICVMLATFTALTYDVSSWCYWMHSFCGWHLCLLSVSDAWNQSSKLASYSIVPYCASVPKSSVAHNCHSNATFLIHVFPMWNLNISYLNCVCHGSSFCPVGFNCVWTPDSGDARLVEMSLWLCYQVLTLWDPTFKYVLDFKLCKACNHDTRLIEASGIPLEWQWASDCILQLMGGANIWTLRVWFWKYHINIFGHGQSLSRDERDIHCQVLCWSCHHGVLDCVHSFKYHQRRFNRVIEVTVINIPFTMLMYVDHSLSRFVTLHH